MKLQITEEQLHKETERIPVVITQLVKAMQEQKVEASQDENQLWTIEANDPKLQYILRVLERRNRYGKR